MSIVLPVQHNIYVGRCIFCSRIQRHLSLLSDDELLALGLWLSLASAGMLSSPLLLGIPRVQHGLLEF